jgi:hypothetical protein
MLADPLMSRHTTLKKGSFSAPASVSRSASQTLQASRAEEVFTEIYSKNAWNGTDSSSGTGSDLFQTRVIAREIPTLCAGLGVATLLDVPCGDFYWMSHVRLGGVDYTGADIVDELVLANQKRYGREGVRFRTLNLIRDTLPRVDLILCRDCLVHLSFADVFTALGRICESGSLYLLTTTFPDRTDNDDIAMGDWRPLNLERAPFALPPALRVINEGCTEGDGFYCDKSLGLWRLADVKQAIQSSLG